MRHLVSGVLAAACWAPMAPAGTTETPIRPMLRETATETVELASVAVARSLRPVLRPISHQTAVDVEPARFKDWVVGFRTRAAGAGIRAGTLDRALRGVSFDADVIRRDRNQSEFTKTIWDYLDTAVSDARVRNGRDALKRHRDTLARIEARFGVDKEIVAAIWGLESAYGGFRGSNNVIRSLATLAFDARRSDFFEEQLIAALRILDAGEVTPEQMNGSWAGAMGHTQFMPTSYLEHAVDFTGDGKRDIWSDDPTDALASTAAYLAGFGWTKGQPWGVEVRLPENFDYAIARRDLTRMPSEWAELGVLDVGGQPVPNHGRASILLPAGGDGAAFMIFDNFEVLERYNTADAYVIGVGHLADRISGGLPIQSTWPRGDRALTLDERMEMQRRLTEKGFDTQGIDGRIGPLTIQAVRAFQLSSGLLPDGYASLRLLDRLR